MVSELQPAKQKTISLCLHTRPANHGKAQVQTQGSLGQRSLAWFTQKQGFTLQLFVIVQFLNLFFSLLFLALSYDLSYSV